MDDTVIINKLKELVEIHGSQGEAAKHIYNRKTHKPITQAYLSMLISGERPVPEWLAEVFSYRAEWTYYPIKK